MKRVFIIGILIILPLFIWAGGSKEESADRGKYVAGQERIISPDELNIDSYISQINYQYPDPKRDLSVTLYAGHRQVSIHGQEEVIQIGIQGKRENFEDLPPMNLAFVFDKSGSMSGKDKIEWVKEAFKIFIYRLRERDTVSIIAFAEKADILLPATGLDKIRSRKELIERVLTVKPEGKSNLKAGLLAGYEQVKSRYKPGSVNRVLFISDGLGEPNGILDMADKYKGEGINVSTIGVGMKFNFDLMGQLMTRGGGSSRFMSNIEKINSIFNTDLDRMVVPVAYDLTMEIEFLQEVKIHDTWGYDHVIKGRKIQYYLATLHNRDYETILIRVTIPSGHSTGTKDFAKFSLTYRDRSGRQRSSGPHFIELKYSDLVVSQPGFSNPMVLKAGTMLHIARALKDIGTLYYSSQEDNQKLYSIYNPIIWQNRGVEQKTQYDDVVQREREEMQKSIRARKQRCLDISVALKKEIHNVHLRLEQEIYKDELDIFQMYIKKLSRELGLANEVATKLLEETEIVPTVAAASINRQISDLVDELMLEFETKSGTVVFSGFTQKLGESSSLKRLIDDMMKAELKKTPALSIVPDWKLESFLKEKDLTHHDLTDTGVALKTTVKLEADYIMTGSIIEMSSSVVLFARVLNGKTGTVDSVAQLILPLNDRVRKLLSPSS